jgi:hypothetical protein
MKMKNMMDELLQEQVDELREQLAELQAKHMTPAPGVGEYVFEFEHPRGDTITCHLEYDAGDETEPERMTLVGAYFGGLDVQGLLPFGMIDQIEAEAVKEWQ